MWSGLTSHIDLRDYGAYDNFLAHVVVTQLGSFTVVICLTPAYVACSANIRGSSLKGKH